MKKQAALRLVDTRTLDRQQWLEVGDHHVLNCLAAAAVGLNPYKSPLALWMDKTGRVVEQQDVAQDMDDPCYWGTLLEPYVAAAYQRRTGRKVRKVNAVLQHPTFPFLLVNLDREIVGDPDVQILECKTAGEFGARLWKDGVPDYVQLQVQHQLAVTGKQAADVAVLLCGQQLEVHRIERDDELIGRLTLLETRFWEHVETDTPPPADGSESSAKALRQLYRDQGTVLDFTGNTDLDGAFNTLVSLREELDAKGQEAERLKQIIQQAMGEASKACFSRGEVTYKGAKDGTNWDVKRLALDHPDLAAQYLVTRPGARRFVVTPHPAA